MYFQRRAQLINEQICFIRAIFSSDNLVLYVVANFKRCAITVLYFDYKVFGPHRLHVFY